MPKVSICIPAYNQTKVLAKTLDSILIQSFTDYEVIVTDDSPSNMVKDLLDTYDFKGRLQYHHNSTALGSPQNWNYCISKARGQYIKILHHDDWFNYEYSLAEYVKLLDDNPDASIGFSASSVVHSNGHNWVNTVSAQELLAIQNNPVSLYIINKIGAPSAMIFRSSEKQLFDQHLKWLVDIEFYIQLLINNGKLAYHPQALITTYGDEGRVTDECIDDKQVQIFEHFYVADKIARLISKADLALCHQHIIQVCNKYHITSIAQIRAYGVKGKIPSPVARYLFFNRRIIAVKNKVKKFYHFINRAHQ